MTRVTSAAVDALRHCAKVLHSSMFAEVPWDRYAGCGDENVTDENTVFEDKLEAYLGTGRAMYEYRIFDESDDGDGALIAIQMRFIEDDDSLFVQERE